MFIIKMQGALGNQMFEYAFLNKMKTIYPDTTFKIHVGNIKDFNGYELEKVFDLKPIHSSWKEVAILSDRFPEECAFSGLINKVRRWEILNNGHKLSHIYQDDYTSFYEEVFHLNPLYSYYFDGVWANTDYISDIRNKLQDVFTFKKNLDGTNMMMSQKMQKENSVSIHVRRNEYVTMGLSVTSDDYYKKSIEIIKSKVSNPVFYVFSDDHEYCKKLFSGIIDYKLITGNNGENSYMDMQLMTYCRHNIIANSTFSFWGAFLGKNPSKIVIAPNISWGNLRHPYALNDWTVVDAK